MEIKRQRLLVPSSVILLLALVLVIPEISSNFVSADTLGTAGVPQAPTGLQASGYDDQVGIVLNWNSPSDSGSPVVGYKIERSSDVGSTWTTIVPNTASNQTQYDENCLAADTEYTYRVSAINSAGISDPSNATSTITHGAMVPDPPTSLQANVSSLSQIHLSWVAPSCVEGSTITEYKIERSVDGGVTWSTISPRSSETFFDDIGFDHSKTITYSVSAINAAGESIPYYVSVNLP